MKALITGIRGFVGKHLSQHLCGKGWEVEGISSSKEGNKKLWKADLLNQEELLDAIRGSNPTHIFHLGGLSDVKQSWNFPHEYLRVNALGTYNVLNAVRQINPEIKVVTVGSSEEYGLGAHGRVDESQPLQPLSPYGVSKCTAGFYAMHFAKAYQMHVIHARPFNHIGPGQKEGFAVVDFAKQIAHINKYPEKPAVISVGNLESTRDFTDVRDIADAYSSLAVKGKPGEVYNVASGKGMKIKDILKILLSFSSRPIQTIVDPGKLRQAEISVQVGDNRKLNQATDWKPEQDIELTLSEIYKDWLDLA